MERAASGTNDEGTAGETGQSMSSRPAGAERGEDRAKRSSDRAGMEGKHDMMPEKIDRNTATSALPQHSALELTEGGSLAQIVLNDQIYTLRITRAGKLILTK